MNTFHIKSGEQPDYATKTRTERTATNTANISSLAEQDQALKPNMLPDPQPESEILYVTSQHKSTMLPATSQTKATILPATKPISNVFYVSKPELESPPATKTKQDILYDLNKCKPDLRVIRLLSNMSKNHELRLE